MAIKMRTTVQRRGVLYEVLDDRRVLWTSFVAFGRRREFRAGGLAFKQEARRQEAEAEAQRLRALKDGAQR